jgi:hypothetical protein
MQIPQFWASESDEVDSPDGKQLHVKCWGWSIDNLEEARGKAREALDRLSSRIRAGLGMASRYGYGNRALREEIIREIPSDGGTPSAIVTRNSYGSLILNTARVMFIDVDVPQSQSGNRLFGWLKPRKQDPAEGVLLRLRSGLDESGGSFRLYRTAAGFRVLATDPLFEPADSASEQMMERVGADPAFVKLCRAQRSFRARLTPKPWRCGQPRPPAQFPREDSQQEARFERWLSDYESACESWATCRFVEEIGPGRVEVEAQPLLDLHDEFTRLDSKLPLA